MNSKKRTLALILAALMTAGAVSCGGNTADTGDGTKPDVSSDAATETPAMKYEFTKEFEGRTINVMNYADPWTSHSKIYPESEDGEPLNDAEYKAVRKLEEEMGITFVETNVNHEEYPTKVGNILASADDEYDIVYVSYQSLYKFATSGYLMNLLDADRLSLQSDWWIHENNELLAVNGKLYSAEGYSNLTVVDFINILMYNETLAEKVGLDAPYDLVKEGKWTLDKFAEYLKAGASLNLGTDADDSDNIWTFDQPGNGSACSGLMVGAGEMTISCDSGKLVFDAGSERFMNICEKIASVMTQNKDVMFNKEPYGVGTVFKTGQALLAYGEITGTASLREANFAFGVLPNPKFDEAQERYYSRKSWPSASVAIPNAAKDAECSAAVADALTYLFYDMVWPVYRGKVLEQKQLRNEESIEMLDIILKSSAPDLSDIFSTGGGDLSNSIGEKLMKGDGSVASLVESSRSKIVEKVNSINSEY